MTAINIVHCASLPSVGNNSQSNAITNSKNSGIHDYEYYQDCRVYSTYQFINTYHELNVVHDLDYS